MLQTVQKMGVKKSGINDKFTEKASLPRLRPWRRLSGEHPGPETRCPQTKMSNTSTIKCPNCRTEFPIGNALAQEIEADIRARYVEHLQKEKSKMDAERALLAQKEEQVKTMAENQEKILSEKLKLARLQLQEEAAKKASEELKAQMDMLSKELEDKRGKLKQSQERELALMQKENQVREREENLKLEMEKQMLERQKEIEERIKKMEGERSDLKIR